VSGKKPGNPGNITLAVFVIMMICLAVVGFVAYESGLAEGAKTVAPCPVRSR
jgi:hypothetical protein